MSKGTPRLGTAEYGVVAQEFLKAHEPGEDQIAGLVERLYMLGYEHGFDDGASDAMQRWEELTRGMRQA